MDKPKESAFDKLEEIRENNRNRQRKWRATKTGLQEIRLTEQLGSTNTTATYELEKLRQKGRERKQKLR